jgi:hypothetical protein
VALSTVSTTISAGDRQPGKVVRAEGALGHEDVELALGLLNRLRRPLARAREAAAVEAGLRAEGDVRRDLGRDRLDLLHADAVQRRVEAAGLRV